jgi:Ca-activated chloride channel family protein
MVEAGSKQRAGDMGRGDGEGYKDDAAESPQFDLTDKSIDFLGFRLLRHLLGSLGRSSLGHHETAHLSTGVEAYQVSKEYEFGDTLNLDISATLMRTVAREGLGGSLGLEYSDLMVQQTEYQSSCATVLLLDTSHSMILYGEDRSTGRSPWRYHLIRTQYPGIPLTGAIPRFSGRIQ